jgi:hypothetical protein
MQLLQKFNELPIAILILAGISIFPVARAYILALSKTGFDELHHTKIIICGRNF